MSCRFLVCVLAFALAAGAARAQDANPANSAVWNKVHASVFAGAAIEAADNVVALETPMRAEDAAIVPVAIRSRFAQGTERFIETIWLIVDNNPSPIAAVFHFTPDSGRADMETRIRVEQYTHVRAVARTSDGKLYMAANYVKASGGCSAPAGKDAVAARASLGKMRMRVDDPLGSGQARARATDDQPPERLGARDGSGHAPLRTAAFRTQGFASVTQASR